MSFGIKLNNSGNKRVIGSDTTVPRFVGKYNRSTWSVDNETGKHLVFTVNCPEMPLCFLNVPNNKAVSVRKISGSTGSWSVDIIIPEQVISPGDVTLYAFSGGYTTESSGGYGIKIKKSDGEVAFDTGYKHVMIRKAFYGKARSTTTAVNWSTEGISKPAFLCNLWGSGFLYSLIVSRYLWLPMFGFWMPTNITVFLHHRKDHIFTSSTGFSIQEFITREPSPGTAIICGTNWELYSGGVLQSCSGTGDEFKMVASEVAAWKDSSEFGWGAEGIYSMTNACVGDPAATISTGFNPTGITYISIPTSYDVFIIDGADYD
jgi:hypothetical protein